MTWNALLDLDGAATQLHGGKWRKVNIADDLDGSVKLVTDFQGARFGVESISGQVTAYAPIIEKQLRDEGVIDDSCEVIVHAAAHHGGFASVFYTVAPAEVILKYRNLARQFKDFLFVYPLAAVLLKYAQNSGLKDGALLFAHGNRVAVLALRGGEVVAADSLQYSGTLTADCGRIAQRVWSMCLEDHSDKQPAALRFLVLQDAWAVAEEVASLCGAIEERAQAFLGEESVSLTRVDEPSALLADLPIGIGQVPVPDRVLYFCKRGVPWLSAILAIHLLVSLIIGWHWYSQRNDLRASVNEQKSAQPAGLSEALAYTAKDADQLYPELQRIKKMLAARERARLIPELPFLLSDIRAAATDRVNIAMIGAVSSEEGGLVSITFSGKSLENSFESERSFIRELEGRGYKVVKREVDSSATTAGMFKLSIIRSQ